MSMTNGSATARAIKYRPRMKTVIDAAFRMCVSFCRRPPEGWLRQPDLAPRAGARVVSPLGDKRYGFGVFGRKAATTRVRRGVFPSSASVSSADPGVPRRRQNSSPAPPPLLGLAAPRVLVVPRSRRDTAEHCLRESRGQARRGGDRAARRVDTSDVARLPEKELACRILAPVASTPSRSRNSHRRTI